MQESDVKQRPPTETTGSEEMGLSVQGTGNPGGNALHLGEFGQECKYESRKGQSFSAPNGADSCEGTLALS